MGTKLPPGPIFDSAIETDRFDRIPIGPIFKALPTTRQRVGFGANDDPIYLMARSIEDGMVTHNFPTRFDFSIKTPLLDFLRDWQVVEPKPERRAQPWLVPGALTEEMGFAHFEPGRSELWKIFAVCGKHVLYGDETWCIQRHRGIFLRTCHPWDPTRHHPTLRGTLFSLCRSYSKTLEEIVDHTKTRHEYRDLTLDQIQLEVDACVNAGILLAARMPEGNISYGTSYETRFRDLNQTAPIVTARRSRLERV